MPEDTHEISLPEACLQLGISYAVGWRRLLTGQLEGKRRGARWFVSAASVEAARERHMRAEVNSLPPAA